MTSLRPRHFLLPLLGLLPFALAGEQTVNTSTAPTSPPAITTSTANTSAPATEASSTASANNTVTAADQQTEASAANPEETAEGNSKGRYTPKIISRISGLFEIELPRLDPPGTTKLIFHPHIGDLFRRGYIRTDVGFRWAANEHFGMHAQVDTYATHGLRASRHGYGMGRVRGGFKYVIPEWPTRRYQTSLGFDTVIPVDTPPVDMTDGLAHYTPNMVVQYRPAKHPRWTTFAGTSLDFVEKTDILGTPLINTPREDSISFTTGAIYDMGQLKWTVQGTYTNTSLMGGASENYFALKPSVLWYVPRRYAFVSKTQWIIGLGANATWGPDGFHLSSSSRVRAEITFRQVMAKLRDVTSRD